MSGLLGNALPALYGASNKLKKNVKNALVDPLGFMESAVQNVLTDAMNARGLLAAAVDESAANLRAGRGMEYGPANQRAANALADAYNPAGITVWHGSPHSFAKFDASKIGTGEGAQAYGHGLYFAESPDVAKQYQEVLSGPAVGVRGRKAQPAAGTPADTALAWLYGNDYGTARTGLLDATKTAAPQNVDHFQRAARVLDYWEGAGATPTTGGSLYKVDLPDPAVERMLDWDKPLSRQPVNIREAARLLDDSLPPDITGAKLYERLMYQNRDAAIAAGRNAQTTMGMAQARAAEDLRAFDIPGIRYLDGQSRGVGGTSNFVVFPGEERLLKIIERNGQPLP